MQWNRIASPSTILRHSRGRTAALLAGASLFSSGALGQSCAEPSFAAPARFPVGDSPYGVVIADFNQDGNQDIATTNDDAANVSVLLGNGDGTLQPHQTYAVGRRPWHLAAADFNDDEALDLVVVNFNDFAISMLLGNGDGTFQSQRVYPVGRNPTRLAVADLNGDGHEDVAVTNYDSLDRTRTSVCCWAMATAACSLSRP